MNYEALCAYAGEFLADSWPIPVNVGSGGVVPDVSVAVYVAVGVDATVLYVGSVWRPSDDHGVRSRIDEHLRKYDRHLTWDRVYIVPLRRDTPVDEVRRIEGRIGIHLAPSMSGALPRLKRPRTDG